MYSGADQSVWRASNDTRHSLLPRARAAPPKAMSSSSVTPLFVVGLGIVGSVQLRRYKLVSGPWTHQALHAISPETTL